MENFSKGLEIKNLRVDICDWLFVETKCIHPYVNKINLFGSVARDSFKPNDCDVFFVASVECDKKCWFLIKDKVSQIMTEFLCKFNLPLSAILLTHNEWEELQDFFGYDQISIL